MACSFNRIKLFAFMLAFGFLLGLLGKGVEAGLPKGFIVLSSGEDGQIGTNDDICALGGEEVARGVPPVKLTDLKLVPSCAPAQGQEGPQPLQTEVPEGWIGVYTAEQLAKIGKDPDYPLNGKYILMACLDLSSYSENGGWEPIGNYAATGKSFTGTFDGNGLVIRNLKISRPGTSYQGLFGVISGAEIRNLGVENVDVLGYSCTGALVGRNSNGIVSNCYSVGRVSGAWITGGLVGYNTGGTVSGCYSVCTVSADLYYTGGLVGKNEDGGKIFNSYAMGSVKGHNYTGGLVGRNMSNSTIANCYSTGGVSSSGTCAIGGLVGESVSNSTVFNSYWNIETSGQPDRPNQPESAEGAGKTTAEMKQKSTYRGWDFENIWTIVEGKTYPYLICNPQLPPPQ